HEPGAQRHRRAADPHRLEPRPRRRPLPPGLINPPPPADRAHRPLHENRVQPKSTQPNYASHSKNHLCKAPAKAGIYLSAIRSTEKWAPAFAGERFRRAHITCSIEPCPLFNPPAGTAPPRRAGTDKA